MLLSFSPKLHATVEWPSIRHMGDNLIEAAPGIEEFHVFTTEIDLDDDWDDLKEESQDRQEKINKLALILQKGVPIGKKFKVHQELLELLEQEIAFQIYSRDYNFQKNYDRWLIELEETKPQRSSERLVELKLKALNLSRTAANDYKKLEPEYTQYQLIKFYIINDNENFSFYYNKFKKKFPKSTQLAELSHYVGEYYLSKKEWQKAETAFKSALSLNSKVSKPYTAYMLAWTSLLKTQASKKTSDKLMAHKRAKIAFKLAMKLAKDWDEIETPYPFRKQVAHDLAWYWASQGKDSKEVKDFFEEADLEASHLPYLYYRAIVASRKQSKKASLDAFTTLLKEARESKELTFYQVKVLEASLKLGLYDNLIKVFDDLIKTSHKDSDWVDEWDKDEGFIQLVQAQAPYYLRTTVLALHQDAAKLASKIAKTKSKKKKAQKQQEYQLALSHISSLYKLFYENYPKDKEHSNLAFNYGNVLFELQDFQKASQLFSQLAKVPSKVQQNAAYNAVMAAYSLTQQGKTPELPEPGKAPAPIQVPAAQTLLIANIDFFVKNFPAANENLSSRYTAAQILFDFGHYERSFKRFKTIAAKFPKTAEGENAMRTVLSFYWEKEDWTKVVEIATDFITKPEIVAAGHEKFLDEALTYAKSQVAISKKWFNSHKMSLAKILSIR